jgi:hypothetical protein
MARNRTQIDAHLDRRQIVAGKADIHLSKTARMSDRRRAEQQSEK